MRRTLTESQKKRVAASNGWRCGVCSSLLNATYQIDHIVPLWQGGPDTIDNCQSLCSGCHAWKTQEEAIQRSTKRIRSMRCSVCGEAASPYFLHKCGS